MSSSGASRKTDSSRKATLAGLRTQIDRLDRQLVSLMNERAEVAREIGHIKQTSGQQTYDPSREETVLERVAAANGGPLLDEDGLDLFPQHSEQQTHPKREQHLVIHKHMRNIKNNNTHHPVEIKYCHSKR